MWLKKHWSGMMATIAVAAVCFLGTKVIADENFRGTVETWLALTSNRLDRIEDKLDRLIEKEIEDGPH